MKRSVESNKLLSESGVAMWNSALIEEIYSRKIAEKSDDRDNLLRLTSQSLYGEKIHYVLELIQNAEDEGALSITFIFDDEKVTVINDGEPFDKEDVWTICSVRPGRKKNKIGFFGIGFKSVFNITNAPQIVSGEFNFQIENYIYPKPLSSLPSEVSYSPDKGAIFVLPYAEGLSSRQELVANLQQIDENLLLFLDSLQEVKFIDKVTNEAWSIQKEPAADGVYVLRNSRTGDETRWKVFDEDLVVPDTDKELVPEDKKGIDETRVIVSFPQDGLTRERAKASVVYCYLPTKRRTDLPFLIQADFYPTIGRENIAENKWNKWLLENLGRLAAEALDSLKNDPGFAHFFYELIPLPDELKDDMIRSCLGDSLYHCLHRKEIAKTKGTGWVKPMQCAIPGDSRVRNILSELDLLTLYGIRMLYADPSLSKRGETILTYLGAHFVHIEQVLELIKNREAIQSRKKEWFLELYDYLGAVFNVDKQYLWDEEKEALFDVLKKTPFILSDDDRLVPLEDPNMPDRLICYPQSMDLADVHQLFTEGEVVFVSRYFQEASVMGRKTDSPDLEEAKVRVKEFFDKIGVKKYFKQYHIISQVILPKFSSGKYKAYDDVKLYRLADYIRRNLSAWEAEYRKSKTRVVEAEIFEEIRTKLLLKAYSCADGVSIDSYKLPREVYFTKKYGKTELMEELFDGVPGIFFLSPYYKNREKRETRKKRPGRHKVEYSWRKFFYIMGVWSSPRVFKTKEWQSIAGKPGFGWVKRRYSPSGQHELKGDSTSEDLAKLIVYWSNLTDAKAIRQHMILLWKCLERNWNEIYRQHCKVEYRYFYYTWNTEELDTSSFLEFLREASWVVSSSGNISKPGLLFRDTPQNRMLLGDSAQYVNLPASSAFLRDIGGRIEPTVDEVMNHLKSFREERPILEEDRTEKCAQIYTFLHNAVSLDSSLVEKAKQAFEECELLHIPRKDKSWWKPSHVFWKDCSDLLGNLRGYVQYKDREIYSSGLKGFLEEIGVVYKPSIAHCLEILDEAKIDIEQYKALASRVYRYIDHLLRASEPQIVDWNRPVFLSTGEGFLPPADLYFDDDGQYWQIFGNQVDWLWLPFSWTNVAQFLYTAGFRPVSRDVRIDKRIEEVREVDGDVATRVVQLVSFAEPYLNKRNIQIFEHLAGIELFRKIETLGIYEASQLKLAFHFKTDEKEIVVEDAEREAYLSLEEFRLYVVSEVSPFSTSVARELSRLFKGAEPEVFPFLDSLMVCAMDEDALHHKLEQYSISTPGVTYQAPAAVELVPVGIGTDTGQEETVVDAGVSTPKGAEPPSERPTLPEATIVKSYFIDIDEYVATTEKRLVPYTGAEGDKGMVLQKEVKLRKERDDKESDGPREPRFVVKRQDAETIALAMVLRFEEEAGREPKDRHDQKGIGYDVYSLAEYDEPPERYIEVKHFIGEPGPIVLTAHQWKKAEIERGTYYVYICSHLREGMTPQIYIIRDPVQYLVADTPAEKKISHWHNGVLSIVQYEKV